MEVIGIMLESVQGTVLLFMIFFAIIAFLAFLFIKILPNIGHIGKSGIKFNGGKSSNVSIPLLVRIIGDEYEKYLLSKEEVHTQINQQIKNVQQTALTRAIEYLCLEFSNLYIDTPEDSLSKMGKILELYLHKDFSKILLHQLDMLYTSATFMNKTDLEINNEIQSITDDSIRAMKLKINEYILFSDTKLLHKLFDTATSKIKESIDEAIKNFIKLSKEQQLRIIELTKVKTESIEKKLKELTNEPEKA